MSIEKDKDIKNAVKVVCGHCNGSGTDTRWSNLSQAFADIDMCDPCTGRGHHFMQEWIDNDPVDPPRHDMVRQYYGEE
tara:strand:- start:4497 stop:4730 length:234 start_codon:yes stop_codon:yes gene_type:complete